MEGNGMKQFLGKSGRVVLMELGRNDDVLAVIRTKMDELQIRNATLTSSVGSLQYLVVHKPTTLGAAAVDEFETFEGAMEVCSLIGSVIGGEPHLHIVAAGVDGLHAGHVEPGTQVLYLLELWFTEWEGVDLERKSTPENVKKIFEVR